MKDNSFTKKKLQAWKEVAQQLNGHLRGDGKLFSLAMRWQLSSGFMARIGEHYPSFGHSRMPVTTIMVPMTLQQDFTFHVHPIKGKSPLSKNRQLLNFEHPLFRGHSSDEELLRRLLYAPELKGMIKRVKISELSLEPRENFSVLSLAHPGEIKESSSLYHFVQLTEELVQKLLMLNIIETTPPDRHFL